MPVATFNTSYDEGTLDAPTILALNALAKDRNLTRRRLLELLKHGRILSADVDVEDELDELAADDAAAETRAQEAAEIRAAQMASQGGPPMREAA